MSQNTDREQILSLVKEYCKNYHARPEYKDGDRISYAGRFYGEEEMVNLVDSALEFWLTSGKWTDKFEQEFADFLGVKSVALVNSGSSANLLAFMALTSPLLKERQVKPGDEVITVSAGFPTTVTPIINYGAIPVFVDITIPQYNIDVTQLESALSEKTKAVMIAHTLGNPFDLKAVKEFCDKNNLWLIEDNCDALGSKYTIDGVEKSAISEQAVSTRHTISLWAKVAQFTLLIRYLLKLSSLSAIGDVTVFVQVVKTISVNTVSTVNTVSFHSVTTINTYIRILVTTLKLLICKRQSDARKCKKSTSLQSVAVIIGRNYTSFYPFQIKLFCQHLAKILIQAGLDSLSLVKKALTQLRWLTISKLTVFKHADYLQETLSSTLALTKCVKIKRVIAL